MNKSSAIITFSSIIVLELYIFLEEKKRRIIMAGIDISKLQNAHFDDEEEVMETTSSSSAMAGMVERKDEKKPHTFKFFTPEQRDEFKNIKSKKELDAFYSKYVDGKFDALKKEADRGLQISRSASTSSQEWEKGNKIFNDATDQMVDFVTDLLALKIK